MQVYLVGSSAGTPAAPLPELTCAWMMRKFGRQGVTWSKRSGEVLSSSCSGSVAASTSAASKADGSMARRASRPGVASSACDRSMPTLEHTLVQGALRHAPLSTKKRS